MRILLISNMYPSKDNPQFGIFIKNIENLLLKYSIRLDKIVIEGKSKNILSKVWKYLSFYTKILNTLFKKSYDIVYIHYYSHNSFIIPFAKISKHTKVIVHVHGNDVIPNGKINKLLYHLSKKFSFLVDYWIVPSKYFEKELIRTFNIPREKIFIYPSGGVNRKLFKPKNKILARKKLNLPESNFLIGYISRIDKGKGWDILLKALKCLEVQNIKFKAIFVGDGKEKEDFFKMINNLNLEKKIIYLGKVEHNKLPDIYNSLDIFIFPTKLAESLGLVGLEAMACGIPVIGSRIGGLLDYIEDKVNGFLFEPGNPEDLCKKLREFYNMSHIEKNNLSLAAINTAKQFDSERVTLKLIDFFKSVI